MGLPLRCASAGPAGSGRAASTQGTRRPSGLVVSVAILHVARHPREGIQKGQHIRVG